MAALRSYLVVASVRWAASSYATRGLLCVGARSVEVGMDQDEQACAMTAAGADAAATAAAAAAATETTRTKCLGSFIRRE